jgi:hypothetical protein
VGRQEARAHLQQLVAEAQVQRGGLMLQRLDGAAWTDRPLREELLDLGVSEDAVHAGRRHGMP